MAIEIIDGFKVSSAVPVDNRIVASGSTDRNAITYKYEGLRVFDTSDSIPYVWLNNTWEKENKTALAVPSTVTPGFTTTSSYRSGQILKVYNSNKLLTNSNMFEVEFLNNLGNITSKTIAINHTTPSSVSSSSILDVNGNIKANTFEGSGANITNIDPVNFNTSTNKIQTNQIANGTSGFILQTVDDGLGNLSIQWKNPSSIISPSSVSTSIQTIDTDINYLTFVPQAVGGNLFVYKNTVTQAIGVIPSSGQVVVKSDSTPSTPPYSFIGETNTGIYKSGVGSIAISILSNQKVEIDTYGLKVIKGDATKPGISFIGASNYGIYQSNTGNNRIGLVVAGNEMMRSQSFSTQGNGNTTFYGDGNVLSIQGNTHAYMEFYRNGSSTPDTVSTRSAYIGFTTPSSTTLSIFNQVYNTYIELASSGSNTYISGIKRLSVTNTGITLNGSLLLGLASSSITRFIMGNVIIKPAGFSPTIVRGAGLFTVEYSSYNTHTAVILVSFTTPMVIRPIVIASRSKEYNDGTSRDGGGNVYPFEVSVYDITVNSFYISVTKENNANDPWDSGDYAIRVGFIACS